MIYSGSGYDFLEFRIGILPMLFKHIWTFSILTDPEQLIPDPDSFTSHYTGYSSRLLCSLILFLSCSDSCTGESFTLPHLLLIRIRQNGKKTSLLSDLTLNTKIALRLCHRIWPLLVKSRSGHDNLVDKNKYEC